MNDQDFVHDEGQHDKYFHVLPNMYDDDLDPYEYRLIGHYKRVGVSWEGTRKIAKITRMSVGKVTSTRKSLVDKKLIRVEYLTRKELKDRGFDIKEKNPDDKVKIVVTAVRDVMAENITRYQKGVHVVNTPVQDMNTPVHTVNERITPEVKPNKKQPFPASPKINPILERWAKYETLGNALLKAFKDDFVPVANQPIAAIEPYLMVAEDLTRVGATVEQIALLHKYVTAKAERENWKGFSVKALPKYYPELLRSLAKPAARKPAPITQFDEPTEAERAALLEAVKTERPSWETGKEAVNE